MELEKPFTDFYLAYEEYQRDLEAWNVQYGQPAAAVAEPNLGYEQPETGE